MTLTIRDATQALADTLIPPWLAKPVVERWRCRRCRSIYERDQCPTRYGLIECGPCMYSAQMVDQLEKLTVSHELRIDGMREGVDLMWPPSLFPNGPQMCCNGIECGCQGLPAELPLIYGASRLTLTGTDSPLHPDWVRGLRDQCAAAGVEFVFESWGEWLPLSHWPQDMSYPPSEHGPQGLVAATDLNGTKQGVVSVYRVGRSRSGRTLDGRTHEGGRG